MQTLGIKKIRDGAVIPTRATEGSAGYDLFACLEAPVILSAGGRASISTGIAIAIGDPNIAAFVFGRSGLGIKHGVAPSNAVGVIDSDYRGEIIVGLSNHSDKDYTINPGDRIAQMIFMPVFTPALIESDGLSQTGRGSGGFGSTGQ